jgi:hypothetical protein
MLKSLKVGICALFFNKAYGLRIKNYYLKAIMVEFTAYTFLHNDLQNLKIIKILQKFNF